MSYDVTQNKIQGWMGEDELVWLYETAKNMENVVEVGSWKGKSSHALLSGCKGTVYCVDHFQGSEGEEHSHEEAKRKDLSQEFMDNVGHFENLVLLKMESREAAKTFKNKSVDMVFLDGGHLFPVFMEDLHRWLPKCKKLICGHDAQYPEITEALSRFFQGDYKNPAGMIWEVSI